MEGGEGEDKGGGRVADEEAAAAAVAAAAGIAAGKLQLGGMGMAAAGALPSATAAAM